MSANLNADVHAAFDGELTTNLAELLGESTTAVANAIDAICASVTAAFVRHTTTLDGTERIFRMISEYDDTPINDLRDRILSGDTTGLADNIEDVFGDSTGDFYNLVSNYAHVQTDSVSKLTEIVTPFLLAVCADRKVRATLNRSEVAMLLAAQVQFTVLPEETVERIKTIADSINVHAALDIFVPGSEPLMSNPPLKSEATATPAITPPTAAAIGADGGVQDFSPTVPLESVEPETPTMAVAVQSNATAPAFEPDVLHSPQPIVLPSATSPAPPLWEPASPTQQQPATQQPASDESLAEKVESSYSGSQTNASDRALSSADSSSRSFEAVQLSELAIRPCETNPHFEKTIAQISKEATSRANAKSTRIKSGIDKEGGRNDDVREIESYDAKTRVRESRHRLLRLAVLPMLAVGSIWVLSYAFNGVSKLPVLEPAVLNTQTMPIGLTLPELKTDVQPNSRPTAEFAAAAPVPPATPEEDDASQPQARTAAPPRPSLQMGSLASAPTPSNHPAPQSATTATPNDGFVVAGKYRIPVFAAPRKTGRSYYSHRAPSQPNPRRRPERARIGDWHRGQSNRDCRNTPILPPVPRHC